ncbi:NERD nuclease, partial [Streptomyces triticagri]
MSELRITQWQRFGHDRWYVGLPDGTAVGWLDRTTGRITITDARYGHAALDALQQAVPDYELPATRPPDEARPVVGAQARGGAGEARDAARPPVTA